MTTQFFLRPETRIREFDFTTQPNALPSSIGAVVAEFDRGPLTPTYTSGSTDVFYNLYGPVANPALSYGHDTVQQFLTQSGNCLVKRVVNGALHAGYHVFMSTVLVGSTLTKALRYIPYLFGRASGYEDGIVAPTLLEFSADLIALNSFAMTVTDGSTAVSVGPVVYATSHAQTIAAIATAISTALSTFASGGGAVVQPKVGDKVDCIAVYMPNGVTLNYVSPTITLGASQAVVSVRSPEDAHLFSTQSENPGTWGLDVGYKLTGIDKGVRQRIRMTFSNKLVSLNSFAANINDVAITPVTFASNSDATLAAIAVSIKAHAAISDAYVETVPAGIENDRSIIIIAKDAGANTIAITNAAVTLGASQAAVLVTTTLAGSVSTGSMSFEVYNRSNTARPAEKFTVSQTNHVGGSGTQLRMDSVVNRASNRSDLVRVIPNARLETDKTFQATVDTHMSDPNLIVPNTITWLVGGTNGSAALTSQIANAITDLDDRTTYPFNILMNAGYHAIEIKKALVNLAERRRDCFAIVDMPSDMQKVQDARNYRNDELDIDSSYGMLVTPDVMISDSSTGERRFTPPSGHIGAIFAYSDRAVSIAAAPAGPNRGVLKQALGLRVRYKPADEELLFPIGVNCIIDRPGAGPTLMGEQTLQVRNSILRSVAARRLLSHLEVTIADGTDYSLFEPHTDFTRNSVLQLCRAVLDPYKRSKDLIGYRLQCDEKNNPGELVDAGVLNLRVILKITPKVKGIQLDAVLIKTGASFEEFEVNIDF